MTFENTQVFNFEGALRGMRNPMNSWDKSDSCFGLKDIYNSDSLTDVVDEWIEYENIERSERGLELYSYNMTYYNEYANKYDEYSSWLMNVGIFSSCKDVNEVAFLGPNDLHLAQKLILSGEEHAKFMRQIFVSVDITAPIYFWKEADTYKVGTVANSTSTMHKLATTPITLDCFEIDDYIDYLAIDKEEIEEYNPNLFYDHWHIEMFVDSIIEHLEQLRLMYLKTKDKRYWKELIRWLPESWLQTRTWTANYAVLRNIYFQRRSHKLTEWHQFCDWIKSLPYGKELITLE